MLEIFVGNDVEVPVDTLMLQTGADCFGWFVFLLVCPYFWRESVVQGLSHMLSI